MQPGLAVRTVPARFPNRFSRPEHAGYFPGGSPLDAKEMKKTSSDKKKFSKENIASLHLIFQNRSSAGISTWPESGWLLRLQRASPSASLDKMNFCKYSIENILEKFPCFCQGKFETR